MRQKAKEKTENDDKKSSRRGMSKSLPPRQLRERDKKKPNPDEKPRSKSQPPPTRNRRVAQQRPAPTRKSKTAPRSKSLNSLIASPKTKGKAKVKDAKDGKKDVKDAKKKKTDSKDAKNLNSKKEKESKGEEKSRKNETVKDSKNKKEMIKELKNKKDSRSGKNEKEKKSSSDSSESNDPDEVQLPRRLRVKRVVDAVYTMETAYGFVTPLVRRLSLGGVDEDAEVPSLKNRRRLKPEPPIIGLTGILSGRVSRMTEVGERPVSARHHPLDSMHPLKA